jgi:rubrerythrin
MSFEKIDPGQKSIEVIERLVEEEKEAIESLRARMARVTDPALKECLVTLAKMRSQFVSDLESRVSELRSQAEITTQINAMFW